MRRSKKQASSSIHCTGETCFARDDVPYKHIRDSPRHAPSAAGNTESLNIHTLLERLSLQDDTRDSWVSTYSPVHALLIREKFIPLEGTATPRPMHESEKLWQMPVVFVKEGYIPRRK